MTADPTTTTQAEETVVSPHTESGQTEEPAPVLRVSFWTPKTSLIVLILLLSLIVLRYALPYMSGVLGALTIYVLLRGQMKRLVLHHKWKRGWAATLLLLEAIFFFLIPLFVIVMTLIDVFSSFDPNSLYLLTDQAASIAASIEERLGIDLWSESNIRQLTAMSTALVKMLIQGSSSFFINIFVILFLLYFMLYGFDRFEVAVEELLPFSKKNKQIVSRETVSIVKSNAIGIPLLALVQGLFAYIGYLIFGVNNALLFAVITTFTTVIPLLGTMIVWVPLAVAMGLNGDWLHAVLLAAYGFIVIGGSDNVVRFLLQKRMANIHPLITIFGVFIGLPLFGFWGVIFGPLLISLIVLFINLYRYDFVPGSKTKPTASADAPNPRKQRLAKILNGKGFAKLSDKQKERLKNYLEEYEQ